MTQHLIKNVIDIIDVIVASSYMYQILWRSPFKVAQRYHFMQISGCHGNQKEKLQKSTGPKKNYWSDFKIIWYKWSSGDPLPKVVKIILIG